MNFDQFAYPLEAYGLPSREEMLDYRIWDDHYHGIDQHEEVMRYVTRLGIERVISLDIGGREYREKAHREILEKQRDRVLGIIRIDPSRPEESVAKMEQWIRNGPCIGIKYAGGNEGVTCSHPNNDPIISLARELKAVVYIHAWIKVGGNPRRLGGDNGKSESSPMDVAILAKRFPDVPMTCGHSGGDWEIGARVVRPYENVNFEFAGSDPHSGQVDYAIKILGEDRIVWGGHGPSRCLANELSKILDANLTKEQRMKVFGRNLRRVCAPIMRQKGYSVKI
ncbi:MAG: amidohydrolase family protein [Verrucomicrobia bacterium]|nr:amidohydrolase family protein [Verrucomicrobiota bacterium]